LGKNLARNYFQNPHCKLKTICDLDEKKLRQMQAQFPGAAVTTRFDDLLEDPDLQGIVIATTRRRIIRCARPRCWPARCLCRKAFTLAVEEAEELTDSPRRETGS